MVERVSIIRSAARQTLRVMSDAWTFMKGVESPGTEITHAADTIAFQSVDQPFRFTDQTAAQEMMARLEEYFADQSNSPKFTRAG